MSYFDFFCTHIKNETTEENMRIVGTCYSMCPQVEVNLREKEKMVHALEIIGSERKLVKSYSRSAADSNMTIPHLLRPYSVLKETLQHLLSVVLQRKDVPTCVVYNFIDDRFRSIRQDMTIQRLSTNECASLLEPMIKLCGVSHNDFNPFLNKKYLMECLKWFLYCCDTTEAIKINDIDGLSTFISKLDINNENKQINQENVKIEVDRKLMESLYILCNLDDMHPLIRYLNLPRHLKSDRSSVLLLSYQIAMANLKGNYVTFCRLIKKLDPLLYCTVWLYLPVLQSQHEVTEICKHYGLTIQDEHVRFNKTDFRSDVPLHSLEKNPIDDGKLSIDNIFT
ncbi:hypothetical protein ACJJTC_008550 [Scirpophaga incertulas]